MQLRVVDVLRWSLALLVIANLGRIPVLAAGTRDAPIFLNDVVVLGLFMVGLVGAMQRRKLEFDSTAVLALIFAMIGGFSALVAIPRFGLSAYQFIFSTAYLARWLAYFTFYVVVINHVKRFEVTTVWATLEKAILAFAGFGIVQAIFLPRFAQLVYPDSTLTSDWDDQGHRLVSTFLDPNFAGAFIDIGLLVLLAKLALGARVSRWKLIVLAERFETARFRAEFLAVIERHLEHSSDGRVSRTPNIRLA